LKTRDTNDNIFVGTKIIFNPQFNYSPCKYNGGTNLFCNIIYHFLILVMWGTRLI